jgi:hypothetical protein
VDAWYIWKDRAEPEVKRLKAHIANASTSWRPGWSAMLTH